MTPKTEGPPLRKQPRLSVTFQSRRVQVTVSSATPEAEQQTALPPPSADEPASSDGSPTPSEGRTKRKAFVAATAAIVEHNSPLQPVRSSGPPRVLLGGAAIEVGHTLEVLYVEDGHWYVGKVLHLRLRDGALGLHYPETEGWDAWAEWLENPAQAISDGRLRWPSSQTQQQRPQRPPAVEIDGLEEEDEAERPVSITKPFKMRFKVEWLDSAELASPLSGCSPLAGRPQQWMDDDDEKPAAPQTTTPKTKRRRRLVKRGSPEAAIEREGERAREREQETAKAAVPAPETESELNVAILQELLSMGFAEEEARRAANQTGWKSLQAATDVLLGGGEVESSSSRRRSRHT